MKFLFAATALVAAVTASAIPAELLEERATCPPGGYLAKPYRKPSLFVQTSKKRPDTKLGPTTKPQITPNDLCATVNLELPPSAWDKICRLSLKIPTHAQTPSDYSYSGAGHFQFNGFLTGFGANENTTYNNQPIPGPSPSAPPYIGPGNSYTLLQFPCLFPPLLQDDVTVGGQLCSNDTSFSWVNSDAPCALGFFVEILEFNTTSLQGLHL